jgi:hypothetical protein
MFGTVNGLTEPFSSLLSKPASVTLELGQIFIDLHLVEVQQMDHPARQLKGFYIVHITKNAGYGFERARGHLHLSSSDTSAL